MMSKKNQPAMKRVILLTIAVLLATVLQAQVSKTLNVTAGGLSAALTANEKNTVTNLTLTGTIDARDFKTMRDEMPVLKVVDIKGVTISEYKGKLGTESTNNTTYIANAIPQYAFFIEDGDLTKNRISSIRFPEGITAIGMNAFRNGTGLTSIIFPASVTRIEPAAFYGCSNIPSFMITSIMSVGDVALCESGGSVTVDANNPYYKSEDGVLFSKDGSELIFCPVSKTGSYVITSNVTTLKNCAFRGCGKLTSITIPASVIHVGTGVFYDCTGLNSITIPSSWKNIPEHTFCGCTSLISVVLPLSVSKIDYAAFSNCSKLSSINISSSIKNIGIGAFWNCRTLDSFFIHTDLDTIGMAAFSLCKAQMTVDNNNHMFASEDGVLFNKNKNRLIHCPTSKTGDFVIPSTIDTIDRYAFIGCNYLASVRIPSSVKYIGLSAFSGYCGGCSQLTSIYACSPTPIDLSSPMENGVFAEIDKSTCTLFVPVGSKHLYETAVQWKDFIHIVEMGSDVNNITTIAGELSTHIPTTARDTLTTLTIKGTIDARDFRFMRDNLPKLAVLDIENVDVVAYIGAEGTDPYSNSYQANAIPNYGFFNELKNAGKTSLSKIVFPLSIKSIGISAFCKCTGLKGEFIIPSTVTSMNRYAFMYCTGLTSIKLPSSLRIIDYEVFLGCSSLSGTLTIPSSVFSIGIGAFSECTNLDTVIIPSTVTHIEEMAFAGCGGNLEVDLANSNYSDIDGVLFNKQQSIIIQCPSSKKGNYTIPNSVSEIANYTFYHCENLKSILIPNKVTNIGVYAFAFCKGLTGTFTIPSSVKTLGEFSFGLCTSLYAIIFPSSVTSVGNYTFSGCTSLNSFYVYHDIPFDLSSSLLVFSSVNTKTCTLYIPCGTKQLYEAADQWRDFEHIVEMADIALSKTTLSIPNVGGRDSLVVSSSCGSWTVTSDQPWVKVNPASGTGNQTLVLTIDPNLSSSSRTATITISAGTTTQNLTVNQQAGPAFFLLATPKEISLPPDEASSAQIIVSSNTNWDITNSETWISISSTTGSGNDTLVVVAKENTTLYPRSATITVSANSVSPQVVTINQQPFPTLNLASDTLYVSKNEGSSTSFGIVANISWTAITDNDWLKIDPSKGNSSDTVVFTVKENPLIDQRIGVVRFIGTGVDEKQLVIVQQAGDTILSASPGKITMCFEAGCKASVQVTSNTQWDASSDQPWLSVSPDHFNGNSTVELTAQLNPGETKRTALVTISAYGVKPITITVTQLPTPYLFVSETTLYLLKGYGSSATFSVSSNAIWNASSTQTWIKISPKTGDGDQKVTVTAASANPGTSPRTGSITVSTDGITPIKVTVIQASGDTTLSVTNNIVNIGYAEGSSAWTGITSNTTWNASADQSWLTVTPQNGDGNRNLVFVASENPLTTLRTATVTVSAIGAPTQTITVIQAARPGITIETDTIYIGREEGSTAQLPVSANVSWRAVQDETWLSVDPGSGIGDAVITFTATANPTVAERAAVVSISGINIGITRVTVIQEAALPFLAVEDDGFVIPKEGGSISNVSLASNMNWNASSNQSWLTVSPLTGFGNTTLTFAAGENLSLEQRVAYVTVTGQDVEPVTLKVTQEAGDPYLTLTTDEIHLGYQQGSTATIGITSNTSWTIASDDTWLTANPASGSGDAIITFTTQANPSQMDRPGSVTFTMVGGASQTIMAIQQAKPVSAETFANGLKIQLYPNPVTDGFHLKGIEGKAEITITDLRGRVCLKQSMVANQVVPTGNLAKGVYMVRITDSEGTVEKKLIKE